MLGSLRRWRNDRWRRKRGWDDSTGKWIAVGAAAALLSAGCGGGSRPAPSAAPAPAPSDSLPSDGFSALTIPTAPPTTVVRPQPAPKERVQAPRASRSGVRGDDFWARLAQCENPAGGNRGGHVGYFQFSYDTARKVGIDGSESYEEQRAAAQSWASRVDPGSRSGWPICWHQASR